MKAAALPVVGATAIIALCEIAKLKGGERLLIRGASGGVGSVGVQLGRELGADVTALASASSLDFVRQLGADRAFDYVGTSPEISDPLTSLSTPSAAIQAPIDGCSRPKDA